MSTLSSIESKRWSQHGEDGIIKALTQSLKTRNHRFVEIGAAWEECNSRALEGWEGVVYDIRDVSKFQNGIRKKITPANVTVDFEEPDFFSLDIDSYDYFVADALLRKGFRPKVVCVETNTFIPGSQTVQYHEAHNRYDLHKGYGLYFGCSRDAWIHLWGKYGYRFVGMDSSYTNSFFVRKDQSDWPESDDFGYQTYFCRKYQKTGDELTSTFTRPFLDVTSSAYEMAFQRASTSATSIDVATTYTMEGYERHARKFIDTFVKHWPKEVRLLCYEEPYLGVRTEKNVVELELENKFADALRNRPDANGHIDGKYVWKYDAVKWSHRIFALTAAARASQADILINIDSDIVTFDDIPLEFLTGLLEGADIAYMPRKHMYSECSLVLYRLSNPMVREFIEVHQKMYLNGMIFDIADGWTDCHAFDVLVRVYKEKGMVFKDINEGIPNSSHPFVNGPLGKYMDHMKGHRKDEGKSRRSDLIVKRQEAYWQ